MSKVFSLTKSQELIWLGQQMNPNAPLYNMAFAFDIYGPIEPSVFEAAFLRLISVTDALRMVFQTKEMSPFGMILSSIPFEFKFTDLSDLPDAQSVLNDILDNKCIELLRIDERNFDSALYKISKRHYVWYLNQHHLITDGWSKTVLFQRMATLYAQRRSGEPSCDKFSLYTDFIDFEIKKKEEPGNIKILQYWNETFGYSIPISFLGVQNSDLNTESNRINVYLDQSKVETLKRIALEPEMRGWTIDHTLYNIFLSLLYVQLYRLSGSMQLVVGSPVHNRSRTDFKETVGLFIELFPIAIEISDEDTFISVFKKTQLSTFDFLKNARTGCSSGNVNKQFSAVLNYINVSFGEFAGYSSRSSWLHTGHTDPRHAITLQVQNFNSTSGLDLSFDFNTTIFTEQFDQMAVNQYVGLIDSLILDRTQSIHTLTLKELALLEAFNDTDADYPNSSTVLDLIEKQVAERPDQTAVVFKDRKLTFQQLDYKANQLGHLIQSYGIGQGDLVGVCMDRSLEMIVALLGIIKSGAAYVPLDPNYPKDRIHYILDDIDARVIITNNGHDATIRNDSNQEILRLDQDNELIQGLDTATPSRNIVAADLMYAIYTSGSTGSPKGVINQHNGIVNLIHNLNDIYHLTPNKDVILQKTTFCFDVSVIEIFYPLATGVKVVMAEPDGHMDPLYIERIIDEHMVTLIQFVPSMLDVFLAGISTGSCASLNHVVCMGEALRKSTCGLFFDQLNHVCLHNMYGPTEAAVVVTHKAVSDSMTTAERMTIGRPLNNVKMHVLNDLMKPCAVGSVGQLCIEGIQVARGYHKREHLNRKSFRTIGDKRLYMTGDLARWLPNGELEFLGRIDDQIKIRGLRVELQEIETIALQYAGIEMCAVRALPDYMNSTKLVLNYTANETINISALQAHLAGKLPEYMVPSLIIQLESIPLNSNGKLDKAALPIPDYGAMSSSLDIIEPTNDFESIVLNIWQEVLGVDEISIESNFFTIGGDSLLGIRVVSKINEMIEIDLPVVSIFKYKTVAQLAKRIEDTIKNLLSITEN